MHLKSAAAFVLVSVTALAAACADDAPEPTPTPEPTPELERAVYAPRLFEHRIAVASTEDAWNPAINAALTRQFGQVASIFIANECLAGRPMTAEAFVIYASTQLPDQAQLGVEARRLVGEIVAVSNGPAGDSCVRPFLQPRSEAEFEMIRELVSAALGWTARLLEGENEDRVVRPAGLRQGAIPAVDLLREHRRGLEERQRPVLHPDGRPGRSDAAGRRHAARGHGLGRPVPDRPAQAGGGHGRFSMRPGAAPALRPRRVTRLLPAACASLLLLWGCGGDAPPAPTPPTPTAAPATPTATAAAPADGAIFVDVSDAAGIDFVHDELTWLAVPQGGGIVAFDYDGDGNADAFIANSNGPNVLYRNNGDGTFTDVAAEAGVADADGRGNGGCSADYDNDADADLYITNYGKSRLFENRGDGAFVEASASTGVEEAYAGLRSTGCAWGDYDGDGAPDLVVVRHMYEHRSDLLEDPNYMVVGLGGLILYHNDGDGAFTNVTAMLGDLTPPVEGVPGVDEVKVGNLWGAGFQPGWVDYDNDGDVDLYVVNDFGQALHPNVLWRNDGPAPDGSWTFVDASIGSGADVEIYGMSMSVGDYDQDGFFDIFITDIRGNVLLRNDGNGRTFTDLAEEAGVNIRMIGPPRPRELGLLLLRLRQRRRPRPLHRQRLPRRRHRGRQPAGAA